ncbi:MAG: peptide-methionine (S)-S-oxide reductase MsrA [Bacteroidota bacterium]|jgi:peptide-methionine (S)-S-oxide reductase
MKKSILVLLLATAVVACNAQTKKSGAGIQKVNLNPPKGKAIAAFAEGCFWCSEKIFESVNGIDSVIAGYAGGTKAYPTYEEVSSETTGHAESVLVYYNPQKISYRELVKIFFASHDPTTKDQQGPDVGASYRSVLFYRNAEEKQRATLTIQELSRTGQFKRPIVTELKPLNEFWRAEEYHQDFAKKNPNQSYIRNVSNPRYEQFKKNYQAEKKK